MSKRTLWLDRGIRFLAWIGLLLLALALMRQLDVSALGDHFGELWTGLLAFAGVASLAVFIAIWDRLHHKEPPPAEHKKPLADGTAISVAGNDVDGPSTLLLVAFTNRYLVRVNDKISVRDGYYERKVVGEWVLPENRDVGSKHDIYLLPVLRAQRAKTIDNLVFEDAGGKRISTCNTNEYVAIVRKLLIRTVQVLAGKQQWGDGNSLTEAIDAMLADIRYDSKAHDSDITGETPTMAVEKQSKHSFARLRRSGAHLSGRPKSIGRSGAIVSVPSVAR